MTERESDDDRRLDQGARVPQTVLLAQEVASVETYDVVNARVRVSTRVEHVEAVARADLRSQTVEITRVPIDRPVDQVPAIRTEGDVTIVPIVEEIMVIEKRLILKEELHLRTVSNTETVEQSVTLRRQTAEVERFDAHGHPLKGD